MQDIVRTLQLWCEDGQVYELRVPKTKRRGVISGYFDDLSALTVNADTLSDDMDVPAVYLTLNPALPDLIARRRRGEADDGTGAEVWQADTLRGWGSLGAGRMPVA
jgi:hypothetical protein